MPVPPPTQASASLTCRTVGDEFEARIIVAGELDIATVPTVDAALRRAESTALVVTLDLRGCPEVDWLFALVRIDHELEFVDQPAADAAAPAIGMAA